MSSLLIGLLALQGDYHAHQLALSGLGVDTRLVRVPRDLEGLDGLVIPGGESTVMSRLCERYGLFEPLQARINEGFPVLGTCAGLIFLARNIEGASQTFAQKTLGSLNVGVRRNAYGAQLDSFETELPVPTLGESIHAVFIRAPQIQDIGEGVEVLATYGDAPVLVRQNSIVAASFHPEIAGENRIHRLWLDGIKAENAAVAQESEQGREP